MTRLPFDEHLTGGDDKLAKQVRRTHAGMAHWAGTGPRGKTCRECKFWEFDGYLVSTAQLKSTTCGKYAAMMGGHDGPRVPHHAPSCKYFQGLTDPPAIYDPKA